MVSEKDAEERRQGAEERRHGTDRRNGGAPDADNGSKAPRRGSGPEPTKPVPFSLKIGFFAGIFWGLARWLAAGLHFTYVPQAYLLDPFVPRRWLIGFYWQAAGLGAFIAMSILAALIYVLLLGKLRGPWPGLWFGAVWWALTYAWAGPIVGAVPPLSTIGWNSIVTDFCLYLIWGLFIGYSISFELNNESRREPDDSGKPRGGVGQPAT